MVANPLYLMNDIFIKFQVVGFLDDYKKEGEEIYEDFKNLGKLEDLERVVNVIKRTLQ